MESAAKTHAGAAPLAVFSWNINGIRSQIRKGTLVEFINKYKPDILCIQEIKITEASFAKNNIQKTIEDALNDKYHFFWNFHSDKAHHGTAILSRLEPHAVCRDFPGHKKDGRFIALEFKTFYVVSVYTPNSGVDSSAPLKNLKYRVEEWDPDFQKEINRLRKQKHVIIGGDLNVARTEIDLAHPDKNRRHAGFTDEERQSAEQMFSDGWCDTFREIHPKTVKYTFWSNFANSRRRNVGWRIDYIVVDSDLVPKLQRVDILDHVMGSDHCPVMAEFSIAK